MPARKRITSRQKSARRKNIAIARKHKKKGSAANRPLTAKQKLAVKKIQAKYKKGKTLEKRRRKVPASKLRSAAQKKQKSLNALFKKYKKGGMKNKKMGKKIDRLQTAIVKLSNWHEKNTGRRIRL